MDYFKISRRRATVIEGAIAMVIAVVVCLGYNKLYFEVTLPNHVVGQVLDVMDYVSNNILMPVVAIGTCILIGWVVGPKVVIDEATKTGERFNRKGMYNDFMHKYSYYLQPEKTSPILYLSIRFAR